MVNMETRSLLAQLAWRAIQHARWSATTLWLGEAAARRSGCLAGIVIRGADRADRRKQRRFCAIAERIALPAHSTTAGRDRVFPPSTAVYGRRPRRHLGAGLLSAAHY